MSIMNEYGNQDSEIHRRASGISSHWLAKIREDIKLDELTIPEVRLVMYTAVDHLRHEVAQYIRVKAGNERPILYDSTMYGNVHQSTYSYLDFRATVWMENMAREFEPEYMSVDDTIALMHEAIVGAEADIAAYIIYRQMNLLQEKRALRAAQ